MMLEGDVVLRYQGTSKQQMTPVMSLPPNTDSDVTFNDWVDKVITTKGKGIKLNFKSIEPVEVSLQQLKSLESKLQFPVWLGADILLGPNCVCHKKSGTQPTPRWDLPVDPTRFLRLVTTMFPQSTLCLGWTAHYEKDKDNGGYTWPMVIDMYNYVQKWNAHHQPSVFSIRAPLIRKSVAQIKWLLDMTGAQLHIWAEAEDEFESSLILLLQIMRSKFPKIQIFYQLPEHISGRFSDHIDDIQAGALPKDWSELQLRSFNADQWSTAGAAANSDKNLLYGSEAVVMAREKQPVFIMSKEIYKSTKDYPLHVSGKVTFIEPEHSDEKQEKVDSGLVIYIRASTESNPLTLSGIKCFIAVKAGAVLFNVTAKTTLGKEIKQEGQLQLDNHCVRFDVVDEMKTVYLKVSTLVDCDDPISTAVNEKSSILLDLGEVDVENKNSRVYLETLGVNKQLVIDELKIK
ncbi:uncharacterized protein LOC135487061 isoform X2 [Lineus longissimus]